MDPQFRKILGSSGFKLIYAAIDTYDMAKVVRAAMQALSMMGFNKSNQCDTKSKAQSACCRQEGNENYKAGKNREAIELYNMALAFAPKYSEEMILAYGNRSAVFFSIRYYSACVKDINTCLTMGCSEELAKKLRRRRENATPFIFNEFSVEMTTTKFESSFFKFDCRKNADVPCASADVAFVTNEGVKRATAATNIKPGVLVAYEQAFVSCPLENLYITCYYCNRPDLSLVPCDGCCRAMFCGSLCMERCMREYHCIECEVLQYLASMFETHSNILATRAAIKLSLKMVWSDFITASKNIGMSRMRTATVRQTFNSDEPVSILSYDDRQYFLEGRMFNGGIVCACILHCLTHVQTSYFPKEPAIREEVIDAMARIMLHLVVTFDNKLLIVSSAYDFNRKVFRSSCQVSCGWFSMASKLRHSCEPNLMVIGLNDSVALVTLRTIKKGEELTISYNGHYYDGALPRSQIPRSALIYLQTRQICNCKVCQNNWDQFSPMPAPMTKKQSRLLAKIETNPRFVDYICYDIMCEGLDVFPANSSQHKTAYEAVREMLNAIRCRHPKNYTYIYDN